jgi:hypothetical protein
MAPPRTNLDRCCVQCAVVFRPRRAGQRHCSSRCSHRRHGQTRSRTHRAWSAMRQRCLNRNNARFADYGGRGISICEQWSSFEVFRADMGDCPSGMSLDRIDNNGHYESRNCRWVSMRQQQLNKRTNHWISWNGETLAISEWARRLSMTPTSLRRRLTSELWTLGDALTRVKRRMKLAVRRPRAVPAVKESAAS